MQMPSLHQDPVVSKFISRIKVKKTTTKNRQHISVRHHSLSNDDESINFLHHFGTNKLVFSFSGFITIYYKSRGHLITQWKFTPQFFSKIGTLWYEQGTFS